MAERIADGRYGPSAAANGATALEDGRVTVAAAPFRVCAGPVAAAASDDGASDGRATAAEAIAGNLADPTAAADAVAERIGRCATAADGSSVRAAGRSCAPSPASAAFACLTAAVRRGRSHSS